jgi:invasion protein IalB
MASYGTPRFIRLLAPALVAALACAPAAAQDNDLQLDMGTPVDQGSGEAEAGANYVLEMSGDWEIRCLRTGLEHDPCAIVQILQDEQDNAVATIEVFNLPEGQEAAAGATIETPLETLLNRQITLSVDGAARRQYPFTFCNRSGCVARVGFTEAEVDQFRRGAVAQMTIFPLVAPDTPVTLDISLSGFTAGFSRISELNALYAEAVAEAQAAQQGADGEAGQPAE